MPFSSDLTGGTILLTGPTGGLGSAVLEPLSRSRPAHLVLLGRSRPALEASANRARAAGARAVSVVVVDLADLQDVGSAGRQVAALVEAGAPPLSLIVLNAGLQMGDRRHASAQGLELTFAVNVVAQHMLLRTTAGATAAAGRTVLLGSGTHFGDWHSYGSVPPPVWQDPSLLARVDSDPAPGDAKAGGRGYATSKLAVLYLAHAWQARLVERRFTVFDPGLMPGTGLAREMTGAPLWIWNHVMPAMTFLPAWSTPKRAAQHLTAVALGEIPGSSSTGYVELGKARRSSPASYDPDREQRLWEYLEELTSQYLSGKSTSTVA